MQANLTQSAYANEIGPPKPPRVFVSRLTFSDGRHHSFNANDVVLIVGPNNAGKSAALRAIRDKVQNAAVSSHVVLEVQNSREGSKEDFENWFRASSTRQVDSPPDDPHYQWSGIGLRESQATGLWIQDGRELNVLARWFCHLLSADERLQICNPPGNIALARESPSHPIQSMLRDDKLELRLSAKFRQAFGADLVVHRNAGNSIPLHVGDRPQPLSGEDRASLSYVERLEKLPTLHTQGDGMRSFAGVLLSTSVGKESIMLIDEPEAFLHPPQAKLLGAGLVQDREKHRQLFIATHSTDILRGILNAESSSVKVLRIRRNGSKNAASLLSNARIKELWGDPLLRYSNILDGLFHESVIVCEADSDCRFYAAVLDASLSNKKPGEKRPDVMFTHCGGKSRLAMVIRALREVDVPVKAVSDFDVLSQERPLREIAESLGVAWSSIETDWKLVKTSIDAKKPDLTILDVKKDILTILESVSGNSLPRADKQRIQDVLNQSSAWAHAKKIGKAFVPSGDPMRACDRLLEVLRGSGLHIVEVGELEGYVRTEGNHGPKWVNAVLTRALATDEELEPARRFVERLTK